MATRNPAFTHQLRLVVFPCVSHYLQGFSTIPGGWPWNFWLPSTISLSNQPKRPGQEAPSRGLFLLVKTLPTIKAKRCGSGAMHRWVHRKTSQMCFLWAGSLLSSFLLRFLIPFLFIYCRGCVLDGMLITSMLKSESPKQGTVPSTH